jgi:hypothetical protein
MANQERPKFNTSVIIDKYCFNPFDFDDDLNAMEIAAYIKNLEIILVDSMEWEQDFTAYVNQDGFVAGKTWRFPESFFYQFLRFDIGLELYSYRLNYNLFSDRIFYENGHPDQYDVRISFITLEDLYGHLYGQLSLFIEDYQEYLRSKE